MPESYLNILLIFLSDSLFQKHPPENLLDPDLFIQISKEFFHQFSHRDLRHALILLALSLFKNCDPEFCGLVIFADRHVESGKDVLSGCVLLYADLTAMFIAPLV